MIKLNYELLKGLYRVFSPSMKERKMRRFIKRYISDNVPDAVVEQDAGGNLLVTKGVADSYPCLCAHMDQVQHIHPKDFVCIDGGDAIFGYSPGTKTQCGLGADDKNGIFIALTCLTEYDILKCAFFVGEEIGCVGSNAVDVSFFGDCRFCAQVDRRGNSDMVTNISGASICSEDFIRDADCEAWGYHISDGFMTDVEALRDNGVKASCINVSCGYYEPHTDHEFTVKSDVRKCYEFVCHLIEDCTGCYDFEYHDMEHCGLGVYGSDADWQYDECFEMCDRIVSKNSQLSREDFVRRTYHIFPSLMKKDIESIYDTVKHFYS